MATADPDRERDEPGEIDVDARIVALFAGPPDDFVAGRDALVRDLRAARRTDEIAGVKALRKPKAVARALNAGAAAEPAAVDGLVAAVAAVGQAQDGAGDVRAALTDLRTAERTVTDAAAAAVAGDDRPPDPSTLGAAVRAVLADPDALAALQAGRLADVPAGGGFGLAGLGADLATAPPDTSTKSARKPARPRRQPTTAHDAPAAAPRAASRAASPTAGKKPNEQTTADAGGTRAPASSSRATAAGRAEPRALVAARRAVVDATEALRRAEGGVDEVQDDVAVAEADERAARQAADEAARRAEEARDRALEVARVATAARREAASRARRRDEAATALAKAEARLAKLEPG